MRIFIAGATGTLGLPLVRRLVADGHRVVGLTRSTAKRSLLERLGAIPAIADAMDAQALERAVRDPAPDCVVHALTALPKKGPMRASDMAPTNALRITATAHLLNAAIAADARRIVGESMIFAYGYGDHGEAPKREEDDLQPQEPHEWLQPTVDALRSLEDQLMEADAAGRIEAVPLRFGLFYGAESASTRSLLRLIRKRLVPTVKGQEHALSWLHLEDAVSATVAAIETGSHGRIYNIVDDEPVGMNEWIRRAASAVGAPRPWSIPHWALRRLAPYMSTVFATRLAIDNTRAKRELAWAPAYPESRRGLAAAAAKMEDSK